MLLTGQLPLSNRGKIAFNNLVTKVIPLYEELENLKSGQPIRQMPVNLQLSSGTLHGEVEVYGDRFIGRQLHSKMKKELFPAFTRYCCLRAQELPFHFYFRKKTKLLTIDAAQVSPTQANQWLELVTKGMLEGTDKPFLLFPELKNAKLNSYFDEGKEGLQKKVENELNRSENQYLLKALELGFFGPAFFDEQKANTEIIVGFLNGIDENILKE
jgi:exonuclease V gamma subunit